MNSRISAASVTRSSYESSRRSAGLLILSRITALRYPSCPGIGTLASRFAPNLHALRTPSRRHPRQHIDLCHGPLSISHPHGPVPARYPAPRVRPGGAGVAPSGSAGAGGGAGGRAVRGVGRRRHRPRPLEILPPVHHGLEPARPPAHRGNRVLRGHPHLRAADVRSGTADAERQVSEVREYTFAAGMAVVAVVVAELLWFRTG